MAEIVDTNVYPKADQIETLTEEEKDKMPGRKFGWIPDVPDIRDLHYKAATNFNELPEKVDLREYCDSVLDQGSLGSCGWNALAESYLFAQNKEALLTESTTDDAAEFLPSRLFGYYCTRALEGSVSSDSGIMIRDGIKVMANTGICHESLWPYSDKLRVFPSYLDKPSDECYAEARGRLVTSYRRIVNLHDLKDCLAGGFPVVFGFSVYESFMGDDVAATGVAPMPSGNESLLGGHAVLCVGYDDSTGCLIVMNSWGPAWGNKGFFYLPYGFVTEGLADDFWSVLHS